MLGVLGLGWALFRQTMGFALSQVLLESADLVGGKRVVVFGFVLQQGKVLAVFHVAVVGFNLKIDWVPFKFV